MSSVQLIFVFLRSILRNQAELAAENLVFTNATQAAEQGSKVGGLAQPLHHLAEKHLQTL